MCAGQLPGVSGHCRGARRSCCCGGKRPGALVQGLLLMPGLGGRGRRTAAAAADLRGRLGGVVAEVHGVSEGKHWHPRLVAAVGRGYPLQLQHPGHHVMLGTLHEGRAPGMRVSDIPSDTSPAPPVDAPVKLGAACAPPLHLPMPSGCLR